MTTATATAPAMAYIGRAACGCIRLATVDNPDHARDVAREIGRAVRDGLKVERVTVEYVRTAPWNCDAHKRSETPEKPVRGRRRRG